MANNKDSNSFIKIETPYSVANIEFKVLFHRVKGNPTEPIISGVETNGVIPSIYQRGLPYEAIKNATGVNVYNYFNAQRKTFIVPFSNVVCPRISKSLGGNIEYILAPDDDVKIIFNDDYKAFNFMATVNKANYTTSKFIAELFDDSIVEIPVTITESQISANIDGRRIKSFSIINTGDKSLTLTNLEMDASVDF